MLDFLSEIVFLGHQECLALCWGVVLWPHGEQVDVGLESVSSATVSASC